MTDIDLPPFAPALMEATRAIGYSFQTALADILDNSVAAGASNININFFPIDEAYIAILDNGSGMDKEELISAMRYGSRNPLDTRSEMDLGRFGMGLKTASMSQCRKLTVVSKKNGEVHGVCWDLDYVAKTKNWSLKVLNLEEVKENKQLQKLKSQKSGTMVLWENLDRMKLRETNFDSNMGKYIDEARTHLALVFHRYIDGEKGLKKIELKINENIVESIDPFLLGKSTQSMDEEIIHVGSEKVIMRPYTLPHISNLTRKEIEMLGGKDGIRKRQGFYVYRNKRLLVWGTWFNLMRKGDLTKLARVQLDIPNSLDSYWTLDIKKSMAVPPEVVKRSVAPIMNRFGETSKRVWTFRGKKETEGPINHLWIRIKTRDNGIVYELNRSHPIIEAVSANENFSETLIEKLLLQIEATLPLNQLYIDLTNDEKIENENSSSLDEIIDLAKSLLNSCKSKNEREAMLQTLANNEPFDKYAEKLKNLE